MSKAANNVEDLSGPDLKEAVSHVEELASGSAVHQGPLAAALAEVEALSPEEWAAAEKRVVRKVDTRLLPVLFILLVLNYLDRNALA
jgi:hypothetical protein